MAKVHIVSTLPQEHPFVQTELEESPETKAFHRIISPDSGTDESIARQICNQVMDLSIRVGSTVIFIFDNSHVIEENICISCLQRRFSDSVMVFVRRGERNPQRIPWLLTLRERKEPQDGGMVTHSYPGCGGSCSGNCSSC